MLSTEYPASDTAMTAGGGTTLPGVQEYCLNAACTRTYVIDIPHHRMWGWDHLEGLCQALGQTLSECGIFAVGSGGGVSVFFSEPAYQFGTVGIQLSQPGQVFIAGSGIAEEDEIGTYFALPAFYPGRNVPDVSFNADPRTGYIVYYTSSVSGYGEEPFWGGAGASLNPIAYGDNWFYHGGVPYSPAAGLGTLDVANFARFLQGGR